MKKEAAPTRNFLRRKLVERLLAAKLPADKDRFSWQELKDAGLIQEYNRPVGWDDGTFRLFVLLSAQANALRSEVAKLEKRNALLEDYRSPIWDQARDELCPVKEAELRRAAEEEDRRVNGQRRKSSNSLPDFSLFIKLISGREWKSRDWRSARLRFSPVLWHEPMTVMDHHEATGLSRRTVQNILDRAGARPLIDRKRRNQALQYGTDANTAVLCRWLVGHVKDPHKRKALVARTLIHCRYKAPEQFGLTFRAIFPALQSLGLGSPERMQDFGNYLKACNQKLQSLYQPPPSLPDPYLHLFAQPQPS